MVASTSGYTRPTLQARILYIDPESKVIRLSLLRHLRNYHLPETLPQLGEIYDAATVIRPDKSLGLLIEVRRAPPRLSRISQYTLLQPNNVSHPP